MAVKRTIPSWSLSDYRGPESFYLGSKLLLWHVGPNLLLFPIVDRAASVLDSFISWLVWAVTRSDSLGCDKADKLDENINRITPVS
jgi:hypothetical protein